MVLDQDVVDWLSANGFKPQGPLDHFWMNDEGFVLGELQLMGETPDSLDELLRMLRQHKRKRPTKPPRRTPPGSVDQPHYQRGDTKVRGSRRLKPLKPAKALKRRRYS